MEEQTVSKAQAAAEIPEPLSTLSPEDQELLRQDREARDNPAWESGGPLDKPEFHHARIRYMEAFSAYHRAREAAGLPMPHVDLVAEMRKIRQARIERQRLRREAQEAGVT